jgi:hypothetical protein
MKSKTEQSGATKKTMNYRKIEHQIFVCHSSGTPTTSEYPQSNAYNRKPLIHNIHLKKKIVFNFAINMSEREKHSCKCE